MIAHDLIADMLRDTRCKAALEEIATFTLGDVTTGPPTVSQTFTANLDAGPKTVRVTIEMIPEGEMFADDLAG